MDKILSVQWQGDAGHAWLGVTANDVARVGLRERDFSPYSYKALMGSVAVVYWLEEDCDAGFFIKAAKDRGFELHVLPSCETEGESPIRRLPRLKGESLLFKAAMAKEGAAAE
jgi:hypothetical protein